MVYRQTDFLIVIMLLLRQHTYQMHALLTRPWRGASSLPFKIFNLVLYWESVELLLLHMQKKRKKERGLKKEEERTRRLLQNSHIWAGQNFAESSEETHLVIAWSQFQRLVKN